MVEPVLDNLGEIQEIDSKGMLDHIANWPEQLDRALVEANAFAFPEAWKHPANVVLIGTGGGSGTGGELVRALLFDQLRVPFVVVSGYRLPSWANAHTLAIAVSHSGNTAEVLSAFREARARGCRTVVLTGGGKLAAAKGGALFYPMRGTAMPRAMLGEILVALLRILHQADLIADLSAELRSAASLLREARPRWTADVPTSQNRAKQLADAMLDKVPLIIGATPETEAVALRWKRQLGENGKVLAFWNVVPSLHHDEIVGWSAESSLTRHFSVVLLRDRYEPTEIQKRLDATRMLLQATDPQTQEKRAGFIEEAWAIGQAPLARLLSLVMLGDFVSCYVAIARRIDPTPVVLIDELKQVMAQ